jgi:hypothetical protein
MMTTSTETSRSSSAAMRCRSGLDAGSGGAAAGSFTVTDL